MRFAATALFLSLCACGSAPQANDAITVEGGSNGATPAAVAPAEASGQPFVSTVLGALALETQSAKIATAKAGRPEVRSFAQALDTTMTGATNELSAIAEQAGLKTEPQAGPTHKSDLALLGSTQGTPLDLAFLEQQQAALTELLGTLRAYKNGGDNVALQRWADKIQAMVAEQLNTVQTLKAVVNDAVNGE